MVEIVFMFSFGVAHPDDPFFDCWERFQKVNKLQFGAKKRSTLWPEDKFFKSNIMDALTVLSICNNVCYNRIIPIVHIFKGKLK